MKNILSILTILFLISACNTGKKLLEKGNYYQAVMQSVEKLKKNPASKKGRATLEDAYPMALQSLLDQIEKEKAAQSDFVYTQSYYVYEDLNRMYEAIMHSPGALTVIKRPKKYYSQLGKVKKKAAEEQYLAGVDQLNIGSRESAKRAYQYLIEADYFVKNYKDVGVKIDEAYERSILRVVANLIPVQSRRYELSADVFYDEVRQSLRNIENNQFIRFYTPSQARSQGISSPHQFLVINFEEFVVGQTHVKERVTTIKKDSVSIGSSILNNGSKTEILGTVEAELTTFHMEVVSNGTIQMRITHGGFDKRILAKQDFGGQFTWISEWATYQGDKRALDDDQLALCKLKRVRPLPPQQMFIEFTKPIHQQVNDRLVKFYAGY